MAAAAEALLLLARAFENQGAVLEVTAGFAVRLTVHCIRCIAKD